MGRGVFRNYYKGHMDKIKGEDGRGKMLHYKFSKLKCGEKKRLKKLINKRKKTKYNQRH